MRVHRQGPGAYTVTDGTRTVHVVRNDLLEARYGQWIAYADWDRSLYTDPCLTKRDAVEHATYMLLEG
jgi:hypothetical protein